MKEIIFASISGGETSGLMGFLLKQQYRNSLDIRYIFMNTSREDDRTLDFVNELDIRFGLNIVWLEAIIDPKKGNGVRHKITNYKDAKRDGSIFEALIAKTGLPSKSLQHCSRDLKQRCAQSYMRSLGLRKCRIAIGYRYDEPKRVNFDKAEKDNLWFPLYNWKITKPQVKAFWATQTFQLGLKEYEGNCKMCFKKSNRKLLSQLLDDPAALNWWINMELKYPFNPANGQITHIFREGRTCADLIELSKEDFEIWEEPVYNNNDRFDFELDAQEDCSESCEAF